MFKPENIFGLVLLLCFLEYIQNLSTFLFLFEAAPHLYVYTGEVHALL
jgi:hypothetical protein